MDISEGLTSSAQYTAVCKLVRSVHISEIIDFLLHTGDAELNEGDWELYSIDMYGSHKYCRHSRSARDDHEHEPVSLMDICGRSEMGLYPGDVGLNEGDQELSQGDREMNEDIIVGRILSYVVPM